MQKLKINLFILTLALLLTKAQAGESLFGVSNHSLGLLQTNYSAGGMGRSYEMASSDSLQINYMNFALWADFSRTAYSVKGGYKAAFGEDGIRNRYFNDVAGFENGFILIPIMKKELVFGAGLMPYTYIEQRLRTTSTDSIARELLLKGGLSKAVLNFSYRAFTNMGIGLGLEYNFGSLQKNFRLENNQELTAPLKLNYDYRFYGFNMVGSAFYRPLNRLTLGLSFRPAFTLKVRIDPNTVSEEVNKSTLTSLTLPAQWNGGAEYRLNKRLVTGLDVLYQDWQNGYRLSSGQTDPYQSKYFRIGAGLERRPSPKLFTNFPERLDYRVGFFYSRLSQKSRENFIPEYGFSFGCSFPLQRFRSRIDFAGVVGRRGNLDNNRYQETFVNFGISINAIETWFVNVED